MTGMGPKRGMSSPGEAGFASHAQHALFDGHAACGHARPSEFDNRWARHRVPALAVARGMADRAPGARGTTPRGRVGRTHNKKLRYLHIQITQQ